MDILLKLTIGLMYIHTTYGLCNFPSVFTSREYWFKNRVESQNPTYFTYIQYQSSGRISFYSSNQWSVADTYECNALRRTHDDKKLEFIVHKAGQSVSRCITDHYLPLGVILHKEQYHPGIYTTLQQCEQAGINSVTLYQVYLPVIHPLRQFIWIWQEPSLVCPTLATCDTQQGYQRQCAIQSDSASKLDLDTSVQHFRMNYGQFLMSFSDANSVNTCNGNKNSAASLTPTALYTSFCIELLQTSLPHNGPIYVISEIDPRYLGEPNTSNGVILILKWESKLYCVRYKLIGNVLFLSFDMNSAASTLDCRKDARYDWAGVHDGRNYVLLKLTRDPAGTTLMHRLTTRSFWFSSTPAASTITTPTTTTTMTTTTTTTASTPTTTTKPSNKTQHVQFVITGLKYDSLTEDQKNKIKAEIVNQIATANGMSKDLISNIVLDQDTSGNNMVVTFDSPDSVSTQKLHQLINSGQYSLTLIGGSYVLKKYTLYTWEDDSPCPYDVCETGTKCWIIQEKSECRKTTAVTPAPSTKSGLTKVEIYVIVGVCSFVALAIIIIVVVCVIRSSRSKKENVYYEDNNYHTHHVPSQIYDPEQD